MFNKYIIIIILLIVVCLRVGESTCATPRTDNDRCRANQVCYGEEESTPACYPKSDRCNHCNKNCFMYKGRLVCREETKCPRCPENQYCYDFKDQNDMGPKCYKTSNKCDNCRYPKKCLQYRGNQYKCVNPY